MNSEREQVRKDVLERTAEDLMALSLTIDTMCMGLERESMEPQVRAALTTVKMGISHIQSNIDNALKNEEKKQERHE